MLSVDCVVQYPELGFMSPPGPPHPHPQPPRYRHGSGHSELEPEEGGPSVQYSGNYYGEADIERDWSDYGD